MNNQIIIEKRDQYGRTVYHPINGQAALAAKVAGTKTLTKSCLFLLQDMGFSVQVIPRPDFDQPFTRE